MQLFAALRRLLERRKHVLGHSIKRDIVHDYADFASQTYAPISRLGVFPDVNADQYRVKSKYLDSYEGTSIAFFTQFDLC